MLGFRSLKGSINKLARAADKAHKANLRARSSLDWLLEMQKLYVKKGGLITEFSIVNKHLHINRIALNFAIIYQSENTRMMNPVTRKELKTLFKNLEKSINNN